MLPPLSYADDHAGDSDEYDYEYDNYNNDTFGSDPDVDFEFEVSNTSTGMADRAGPGLPGEPGIDWDIEQEDEQHHQSPFPTSEA